MENNSSIYDKIVEKIIKTEKFDLFFQLIKKEILQSIPLMDPALKELDEEDIQFLLESASIFACSTSDKHKEIAYIIATLLYTQYRTIYSEIGNICALLLLRLGNFPGFMLIQKKDTNPEGINLTRAPTTLQFETVLKSINNRITIEQQELYLTDFQKQLFEYLNKENAFSFSAPTSAGKSFLLILFIINQLKKQEEITIAYIVPTKALINQVKNDIRNKLESFRVSDTRVLSSTVSFELEELNEEFKKSKKTILILTQERLSYLLAKSEFIFNLDILIVDEAQKINDGNRGIILERVIEQTIDKFPNAKFIFSSPLASNPEFFKKYKNTIQNTKTNYSPVHQNVIFVSTNQKRDFLSLLGDFIRPLYGKSDLQKECPKSDKAKMSFLAYHLGKTQSNILYANGPADTEFLAKELCQYLPDVSHKKIDEFSDFISNTIHKDYTLIDCLKKGVAFHYSTMPREIKEMVEELFSDEDVPVYYLCCTSTLLEGMNMPAKNVFIHKPTKGKGHNMGKFDFWNLAGRAGRLLKDYYGNIYCIDIDIWGEDSYVPEKSIENYNIVSATEESIISKNDDLLSYLTNIKQTFPLKEREVLEQTTSTFVIRLFENSSETISKFIADRSLSLSSSKNIENIDSAIKSIVAKSALPKDTIKRNSSIDPRLQNDLYSYFISQFYMVLLPKHPASGKEFYNSLLGIFQVIDRIFLGESDKKMLGRYAVLSSQWINETPLGYLIQSQIDYEERERKFKSVNNCVRKVVDEIDRVITFKYAKYMKCYNDIIEYHLRKMKIESNVINLSTYLEIGAFHPTTLSLLSFGLSRTTSIRIRDLIGNNNLNREDCRKWIQENFQKQKQRLPIICQEDFDKNFE